MGFEESEFLPLSAVQHILFCERQCALIHLEQVWIENSFTAKGRQEHEKVDSGADESRGDLRIVRNVPLKSETLGLVGRTDVLELYQSSANEGGCKIPGIRGYWKVFPIEYKHGKPKKGNHDKAQLCAQALCLEEMLHTKIDKGALFYRKTRKRVIVELDSSLREITDSAISRLHLLMNNGVTPPAVFNSKCSNCSLKDMCLPAKMTGNFSAANYLKKMIKSGD